MEKEFAFRVVTQSRPLVSTDVTEVVLPGFDGEVGILAGHQDFIGVIGTGVLKVVRGGDDYWYMVSSGVFQVQNGEVTVLVESGEDAREVDVESCRTKLRELEDALETKSTSQEIDRTRLEFDRTKARIEAHRRTALLN
jgi:F-type H+-transporting ATPase subunit epsilon